MFTSLPSNWRFQRKQKFPGSKRKPPAANDGEKDTARRPLRQLSPCSIYENLFEDRRLEGFFCLDSKAAAWDFGPHSAKNGAPRVVSQFDDNGATAGVRGGPIHASSARVAPVLDAPIRAERRSFPRQTVASARR